MATDVKIVKSDLGPTGAVLDDCNLGAGIPGPLPNRNIVDADKHTDDAHESRPVEKCAYKNKPGFVRTLLDTGVVDGGALGAISPHIEVPQAQTVEKIVQVPQVTQQQVAVPQFQTIEKILTEDMIVGIYGLQKLVTLNGTVGIVRGFDDASQRYKIQVEDGTIKKFKRCNLAQEEELEDDYDVCDEDNCDSHFKSFIGSSAAPSRH